MAMNLPYTEHWAKYRPIQHKDRGARRSKSHCITNSRLAWLKLLAWWHCTSKLASTNELWNFRASDPILYLGWIDHDKKAIVSVSYKLHMSMLQLNKYVGLKISISRYPQASSLDVTYRRVSLALGGRWHNIQEFLFARQHLSITVLCAVMPRCTQIPNGNFPKWLH